MPPKKQLNKKEDQKRKEKIIEDKTFGIKNKKGNKQQKYIKNVTQQVNQVSSTKKNEQQNTKKTKQEQQEELRQYFNPVVDVPKVQEGTDPKMIICPFFKQGVCTKGKKCMYSHDLQEGRHKSVYIDTRARDEDSNKTEIICKYFLEAVESDLFGWRWVCPNGDTCQYRHCLPQGYILKKDKLLAEKEKEMTIEEFIEKGRASLVGTLTPVTAETFSAWKKKRLMDEMEKKTAERKKTKARRGLGNEMTGREFLEARVREELEIDGEDIDVPESKPEEEVDFLDVDEDLFLKECALDEELADLNLD